jgi:hypothetical protein
MHHIPHFFNVVIVSVKSWTNTSFIIFNVLVTFFEPFVPLKTLEFSQLLPQKPRRVLQNS